MANIIMKDNKEKLQKAVEWLHKCGALLFEVVPVSETFQGKLIWDGLIFVFDLIGHPQATKAYSWSSPIEGSTKRRYYAVLNISPIDSPEKAVRAAIVQEYKRKNTAH